MTGRCWPAGGGGGTLNADGRNPGPYYMLSAPGVALVGSGTITSEDLLERAVAYAMVAIQRALNRQFPARPLLVNGLFDPPTQAGVIRFQSKAMLARDGLLGPKTAKALFQPITTRLATARIPACLLTGQVQNESMFDPGAVGYVDDRDLGLMQINGHWHSDMSEAERFSPVIAIDYAVGMYDYALNELNSNLRDAVASYNLGIGGAKSWISHGRPDVITYYEHPVEIKAYIDRILSECP